MIFFGLVTAVAAIVLSAYLYPTITSRGIASNVKVENGPPKIAVLTDANFSDNGWGESSLQAARYIQQKYNLTVQTKDNVAIPDIDTTLEGYARNGYNLIIAHGVQWGEPALQVAKNYPNTRFVVFTGLVESRNVASIFPQQQEGSYLLGALAAMMTKTGTIGFVGGEEYPNVINIFEGYKTGAKSINSNITVTGTYLNDWDNPQKGREAATSLIRQGADVVFHVADSSGQGVIQAAAENHVYALGAVQDQNHISPETVLCSFVLDVDKGYDSVVQLVLKNNFTGSIFRPGIENDQGSAGDGIVYLAPYHSLEGSVPDNVKNKITRLTKDILDGTIEVPERLE